MSTEKYLGITEVLNEEIRIYDDLLSLSQEKKVVLVAGNTKELDKLIKVEQQLTFEVMQKEREREALVQDLAKTLGLSTEELTVTGLASVAEGDTKNKALIEAGHGLRNAAIRLSDLLGELKSVNDMNKALIEQSLEYIEFSMNMMTSAGQMETTYGNNPQFTASKNKKLFDRKF